LTEEERLAIAAGAESLYERVGRSSQTGARRTSSQGKRVLEAWKRSFSPDDPEAFHRRLTWDALDEAVVEAAWAQTTGGPAREASSWTGWLDAMARESATWARELEIVDIPEELRLLQSDPPRSFVELWIPLIRAACRALGDERFSSLAEPVRYAFMRQWVRELAVYAELAVYDHFSNDRTNGQLAPSSRSRYHQFVHEMLHGGWIRFFKTYPVAARQMARLAGSWAETTRELLDRLESDRPLIAATFAGGEDPGEVALLETGLSDRHNGGRRVVALEFRSGLKLVYKPRHVGLERAYNELLRWAAGRGLDSPPTALRIIERPGYGWVEHIEQGQPENKGEVHEYYRKAGAVICFAHLLRGKDLHMENLVAAADGPVLVDTEMLCQPLVQADDGVAGASERILSSETCLETGILATVHIAPGGTLHDIGGLKGSGGFVSPAKNRLWLEVGNDSLRPAEETAYASQVKNRLFFRGELQRPESYAADILAGFTETYRLALECREELLSSNGPISHFAACDTRVIFRASKRYAVLQYVLAQPKYQREGWIRSVVTDALNREFRGRRDPPSIWPIVATERSALEGLDIPRFELPTTETVLVTESGARLEGHYLLSGFAAVTRRLEMLSEVDLSWQLACLEASLLSSVDTRFVPSGSLPDETTDQPDETLQLMG
jgi:type 2 lantibiotic biosynthesis protein LanM